MSDIKAYTPGIYPRTEELTQAARNPSSAAENALGDQRDANLKALLDLQREADLDYISDGLLDWQDIFQPFEAAAEGLGSNAPATEDPASAEPFGEPFFKIKDLPRGLWMATLPSPHALVERARIEPRAVAERVIGLQIRWLTENGCAYVVLQETALLAGEIDLYPLSEAVEALASPPPLALQLPLGDAGNVLGEPVEIEVHAIGADLFATEVEALPRPFPNTHLAGIVDARNPLLEKMDEGTELHLVPDPTAREKVLRLGAAATILKDENIEEGAVT